jgi:uncharacterized protein YjiS (DUF1127 family)
VKIKKSIFYKILFVAATWLVSNGLLAQEIRDFPLDGDTTFIDTTQFPSPEEPINEPTDVEILSQKNYATRTEQRNSALKSNSISLDKEEKRVVSTPTEVYNRAIKGLDYSEELPKERKKKNGGDDFNKPSLTQSSEKFWIELMKWVFIILASGLFVVLLYQFLNGGDLLKRKNRQLGKASEVFDLAHIEEHLEEVELDPFIKKAVANGQFALAIRLYYLAILKELAAKGSIAWHKQKTNRRYLNEMNSHRLFGDFRQVTRIFERIWYGQTSITEFDFKAIEPSFKELLQETRK